MKIEAVIVFAGMWLFSAAAVAAPDSPERRMKSCMNDMQSHPDHKLKDLDKMRRHCECMRDKQEKQAARSFVEVEKKEPGATKDCERNAGLVK